MRQARVLVQGPHDVLLCVEINQCVGCTRQFFTKSFPGIHAAILGLNERRGTGIATPSSRRRVDDSTATNRVHFHKMA